MNDTAVLDRTISFDAPRDLSQCPDVTQCYRNGVSCHHYHCANCAGILPVGEDVMDDLDCKHQAAQCVDCDRYIHRACAKFAGDQKPRCSDCDSEAEAKFYEENLVVNNMLDAARDLKLAGQRLARETDPEKISAAVTALRDVQIEVSACAAVVAWVRVRAAA